MEVDKFFLLPERRFSRVRSICRQYPHLRTLILIDASKGYIPDSRPESECGFILNIGVSFQGLLSGGKALLLSDLSQQLIEGFDCDIVLFDIDANDKPSEIEYINRDKKVIYDAEKHQPEPLTARQIL